MFGPIFRLTVIGTLCPCLEKDEDTVAREACSSLSSLPIRWYIRSHKSSSSSAGAIVGGFVSGLFGSGSSKASSSSNGAPSSWIKLNATLCIGDSGMGPAIVSSPAEKQDLPQDEIGVMPAEKSVPLKRIGKIKHVDESFLGMGGGCQSTVVCYWKDSEEEILRFDIMLPDDNGETSNTEADADTREDIIGKLMAMVEWDKNRRSALGELDDDEEDEFENEDGDAPGPKNKVRGKAAKVAHFAKREIEMQKRKREREKKKNSYLKDSGGLKYTALAMANRD